MVWHTCWKLCSWWAVFPVHYWTLRHRGWKSCERVIGSSCLDKTLWLWGWVFRVATTTFSAWFSVRRFLCKTYFIFGQSTFFTYYNYSILLDDFGVFGMDLGDELRQLSSSADILSGEWAWEEWEVPRFAGCCLIKKDYQ